MMLAGVVGSGWRNSDPLAAWHGPLASAASAQARAMWVGNSIEEGTGASARRKRALDLVLDDLVRNHPVAGYGRSEYLPAHFAIPSTITPWAPAWRTSQSGTITDYNAGIGGDTGTASNTYGPGMRSSLLANGAIRTYTVTGTDVDIWTAQSGSFQYSVDGGAYSATVSTAAQNAYADITQVHLGAAGVHTIAIKCVTSTALKFLGLTVYDGGRAAGIVLYESCHYGANILDFYDAGTPAAPQNAKFIRSLQIVDPHLLVLNLGLNFPEGTTPAMLATQYASLIDIARATLPSAAVAVCTVYNQATDDTVVRTGYTYGQFKTALEAVFEDKAVPLLRLADTMPNVYDDDGTYYQADGYHMTDAGHALCAEAMGQYIDPLHGTADTAIGVGASVSSTNATSGSVTTQTTGSTIIAITGGQVAAASSLTLTDNKGNTYTQFDTLEYGGAYAMAIWQCVNAVGGPGHTFTQGGGGSRQSMSVVEVKNAALSSVIRDSAGQLTLEGPPFATGSITTAAGDMVIGLVGYDYTANPATVTAGTGYTLQTQSTTDTFIHTAMSSKLAAGTSESSSFNCNIATSSGFAFLASIKPRT